MRLPDELVDLRVGGQVDDEVGLRVLDAVDPAGERRVVAREVLEEVRELVGPRVRRLSMPKTSWPPWSRRSARFVPIWPDDPVIRIFMLSPPRASAGLGYRPDRARVGDLSAVGYDQ